MPAVDTVVKNGRIVTPEGTIAGGVAIDDGKIVALSTDVGLPEADQTIDAQENFVIPGFIDPHTHQGNFHPFAEDVYTDSYLAAQGGVTTFIGIDKATNLYTTKEFKTPEDVVSYKDVFDKSVRIVEQNSIVDFTFTFPILRNEHVDEISYYMTEYGVTSFKFYSGYWGLARRKGGDKWKERLGSIYVDLDDGTMFSGFREIAKMGPPGMALVHAENHGVIRVLRSEVMKEGGNDLVVWEKRSPSYVETMDVREAATYAKLTGCCLYGVHLSSIESVNEIKEARLNGIKAVAETTPYYLLLNYKDDPPGIYGKTHPPIRSEENRIALWNALAKGDIHCVGTDHCSITREEKENFALSVIKAGFSEQIPGQRKEGEPNTVWSIMPGWTGIESFLPSMLSEGVNAGRVTINRIVEVCSRNTAIAFGLYPKKGVLSIGSDADLVIVDLKKKKKVEAQPFPRKSNDVTYNVFEGRELQGWPILTMVRGEIVMQNGEVTGKPGTGRYQKRSTNQKFHGWPP